MHQEQQLCNLKYRTAGGNTTTQANNVADDILNVINMAKDHPFIQKMDILKIMCHL
jgi:hypothetical protein